MRPMSVTNAPSNRIDSFWLNGKSMSHGRRVEWGALGPASNPSTLLPLPGRVRMGVEAEEHEKMDKEA